MLRRTPPPDRGPSPRHLTSSGESRRRWYRTSSPGEGWWFALLLVPTLLTALLVSSRGPAIEADLSAETGAALKAAGFKNIKVKASGRETTLFVPTGGDQEGALKIARTVLGVREVKTVRVARTAAEERACQDLQTKVDTAVGTGGITFSGGSVTMASAGATALGQVAKLLVACPTARIVAEGHTDSTLLEGSTISLRRAEVVKAALVGGGVDGDRIETQGFGDTFPIADNDTASGRALNNRASITVAED